MKSRRRRIPFGENVDPSAFDYTLLNHLYIHDDVNDVIDFGGFTTKVESKHEVQSLLKNRSFVQGGQASAAAAVAAADLAAAASTLATSGGAALLHLQDEDVFVEGGRGGGAETGSTTTTNATAATAYRHHSPARQVSRLVSVEDTDAHIWLVTQSSADRPPYARMFASPESLFAYVEDRGFDIPVRGHKRRPPQQQKAATPTAARPGAEGDVPFPMPQGRREQGSLPTTKWIDIQAEPSDPATSAMLRRLLARFPVDEATIGNCLYLTPQDFVDTSHLSSRATSYAFFMLTCTPLQGLDYGGGSSAAAKHDKSAMHLASRLHLRRGRGKRADSTAATANTATGEQDDVDDGPVSGDGGGRCSSNTKGVMEMRFEAVRLELPHSAVPEPVPVAVLAFADWIITIHEKPFAEMDDLLRIIQLHCSPRPTVMPTTAATTTAVASRAAAQAAATPPQRFTTAFVFTNLLQISIGHHLDSVALAQAVDELGDIVFDIKRTNKEQDKVLQHITAVRRCFGECGADVTRRESIVATLLQPNLSHNFLLRDAGTREQLLNAQVHMRYVQHELSDCRDTVAVSNWYHNVALQWTLLRCGNRALRQLLQLTEMANIMYPIITMQTLYSINVEVPFDAEGDPPNESLIPFFVVAGAIILYTMLCGRAILRMFKRTPFQTKLLA